MESRLERAERKGRPDVIAEIEARLACPPFPEALRYIWEMYQALRRRKPHGQHGPDPIEWLDLFAFSSIMRCRVAPWEANLIFDIDDLYLSHRYKEQGSGKPGVEATPGNPESVKALLGEVGSRRTVQRRQ